MPEAARISRHGFHPQKQGGGAAEQCETKQDANGNSHHRRGAPSGSAVLSGAAHAAVTPDLIPHGESGRIIPSHAPLSAVCVQACLLRVTLFRHEYALLSSFLVKSILRKFI